ncbi:MAG: GNAT family N-acetyltransferase [Clostridia bacterium]|nr:GNAT family N-acetyltransferase [Clostridia bacterium]
MSIQLRTATKEDIDILAKIHSRSLNEAFGEIYKKHFSYEDRYSGFTHELNLGKPNNLLVLYNDEPIGLLTYGGSRYVEIDDDSIELWRIYLEPDFWGRGFGTQTLEKALEIIKSLGYKKVILWVLEKNIRARRFFDKNGFIDSGKQLKDQIGQEIIDLMYVKEI